MSRRLLLTGATGFVGRYVMEAVENHGFPADETIVFPPSHDLRDGAATQAFVAENKPDLVVHLAAQSFIPRSISDPEETYAVNVMGTLHLLEALSSAGFDGRFLYVSSGDVYGRVSDESLPVNGATVASPANPYASSKLAAEELCLQWGRRLGRDVLIARPFNHIGPFQSDRFVVPSLASQIVAIKAGAQAPVLDVGDIESTRDFTDVRDVVDAYAKILEFGQPGKRYIVASGIERKVSEILAELLRLADVEAEVRRDPARFRPAEQRRMAADAAETTRDTGWVRKIEFTQTLNDILKAVR
ncbi:GDP-mannose 4,6-dehydratase [Lysobacter capsici]|uniref:GDP-mannose 4,6-dehydratase n=1 Tax=Lysobacter capsici TaxID=435897 RepID=UPI001C001075|nr:GDP-mannose 4,6-dehydratase [Lysobacter capsici]QWF16149.1 GDP-mannose 4,6-dehydratase [Lysobacter capsici]